MPRNHEIQVRKGRQYSVRKSLNLIFIVLVYMFLIVPILMISLSAFSPKDYLEFPPSGFSLIWFAHIFAHEPFVTSFQTSIEVGIVSTVLSLLIGVPAAYALTRYDFKGKEGLNNFFVSPFIVPAIVFGFSLLQYFIISLDIHIFWALVFGHLVALLPYAIRVTATSFTNFNSSLEEAAMGLGANEFQTFIKVTLPIIRPGLIAAALLSFIESFNNVPVSVFLTGPGISTFPIEMLSYVQNYFDPTIAAISVLMLVATMIGVFMMERLLGLQYFAK